MYWSKRIAFGGWIAGLSFLAACNVVSSLLPAPDLTNLSPNTLNLSTAINTSTSATFSFTNSGDADLDYDITSSDPSITADETNGTVTLGATEDITVTGSCGSTVGFQQETVTVTTNDTTSGTHTVNVNLTCETSDPDFSNLTPTSLSLEAEVNNADTGIFSFQNTGNDTLTYTISTGTAFITPNKTSGAVSPGATEIISLTATCSSTAGTQSGTVTVNTNDTENPNGSVDVDLTCNAISSAFHIDLVFDDDPAFTESRKQVFRDAAAKLEELIVGDLPKDAVPADACGIGSGLPSVDKEVDDIEIFASIKPIDGVNGILGQAGPCWARLASGLPSYGRMEFDSADVGALESSGQFEETILHEMMHVLGVGTIWELDFSSFGGITIDLLDYVTNPPGQDCKVAAGFSTPPSFTGSNANGEYATLGGAGNLPVEDGGGAGTKCGHWDEETFATELMTGFLNAGVTNPLSRMTAASFEDLGYTVSVDAADAYSIPSCSPTCLRTQGFDITDKEILFRARGATGPNGEVILFDHSDH